MPPISKPTTLSQSVANYICQRVASAEWKPGDRIPSNEGLVNQLGVSYTTVREAIQGLSSAGLLDVRHGVGTFIKPSPLWLQNRTEAWHTILEKQALIEILEAREVLEVNMIALAAERATDQDKKTIRQYCDNMRAAIKQGEDYSDHDLNFHKATCEAAHNTLLNNMMDAVYAQFSVVVKVAEQLAEDHEMVIREHESIINAIETGDPDLARKAGMAHYQIVRQHLLKAIQEISEQ